jgi:hypothetical protein
MTPAPASINMGQRSTGLPYLIQSVWRTISMPPEEGGGWAWGTAQHHCRTPSFATSGRQAFGGGPYLTNKTSRRAQCAIRTFSLHEPERKARASPAAAARRERHPFFVSSHRGVCRAMSGDCGPRRARFREDTGLRSPPRGIRTLFCVVSSVVRVLEMWMLSTCHAFLSKRAPRGMWLYTACCAEHTPQARKQFK